MKFPRRAVPNIVPRLLPFLSGLFYSSSSSSLADPCPFERHCKCSHSYDKTTFQSAHCEFKTPLIFDERGGKYKIAGDLVISGDFSIGFSTGHHSLADIFENIGQLTLKNTGKKVSLIDGVKKDTIKDVSVQTLELIGFELYPQAVYAYQACCWQEVDQLVIKKSVIQDNKEGLKFLLEFPKLTSFMVEDTDMRALSSTAFNPVNEKLTELTMRRCKWKEYPILGHMSKLTRLTMENNQIISSRSAVRIPVKIPCMFCGMNELEELHLIGPDIIVAEKAGAFDRLPETLATISLNRGRLNEVPQPVTAKGIQRLSLADNMITSVQVHHFHMHNTLKYLKLNNNPIKRIEKAAMKALETLEELELMNTKLYSFDLSTLTSKMAEMKSLVLDSNKYLKTVTVSDIDQVPPHLSRLTLTQTKLDRLDRSLEELLKRPSFETLDISGSIILDCSHSKWIAIYFTCHKKVKAAGARCRNAKGTSVTEYLQSLPKRHCEHAAQGPATATAAGHGTADIHDEEQYHSAESDHDVAGRAILHPGEAFMGRGLHPGEETRAESEADSSESDWHSDESGGRHAAGYRAGARHAQARNAEARHAESQHHSELATQNAGLEIPNADTDAHDGQHESHPEYGAPHGGTETHQDPLESHSNELDGPEEPHVKMETFEDDDSDDSGDESHELDDAPGETHDHDNSLRSSAEVAEVGSTKKGHSKEDGDDPAFLKLCIRVALPRRQRMIGRKNAQCLPVTSRVDGQSDVVQRRRLIGSGEN